MFHILGGGTVTLHKRHYRFQVTVRDPVPEVKPQDKMRLYTIAFYVPLHPQSGKQFLQREINPITVLALHLQDADKVVVHYTLEEPDRPGAIHSLPDKDVEQIEPMLPLLVREVLTTVGRDIAHCTVTAQRGSLSVAQMQERNKHHTHL